VAAAVAPVPWLDVQPAAPSAAATASARPDAMRPRAVVVRFPCLTAKEDIRREPEGGGEPEGGVDWTEHGL
jgi:hypothetical protein